MFNVAVDYDGTITKNPELYKMMLENWRGEKFILTARPQNERKIVDKLLSDLGFIPNYHYCHVYLYPRSYFYERVNGVPTFYLDETDKVFEDLNEYYKFFEQLKKENALIKIDTEYMLDAIGSWKKDICKRENIEVMFDDNQSNIQYAFDSGVYTFQVNNKFELK